MNAVRIVCGYFAVSFIVALVAGKVLRFCRQERADLLDAAYLRVSRPLPGAGVRQKRSLPPPTLSLVPAGQSRVDVDEIDDFASVAEYGGEVRR